MNREYIKEWVWEKRKILDGDQTYFFAKQSRRERLYMKEGLDFIITDSPLALTTFYGYQYDKYEKEFDACRYMLKQHHSFCKDYGYKVDHFFLVRTKKYNHSGRNESEEKAKEFDEKIKNFLTNYPINYKIILCDENVEENIVNEVFK